MKVWQDFGFLAPIAMLLPLTACAVHAPAEIRASEGRMAQASTISLPVADIELPLRRDFRLALQQSFASYNTQVDEDAPLIADFGISAVDAKVGQIGVIEQPSQDAPLDWQAKPRRGLLFDSCKPVRVQATLAIFDREKGGLVYRGEAAATVCKSSETDLGQLAERLVADARLGEHPGL